MKAMKFNDTDDYTHMTVWQIDGVFSPNRIQKSSLPEGFYRYELSSGRGERFDAITAGRARRYAGDFICKTPLDLPEREAKPLHAEDWHMQDDRMFDFESFWGYKLSFDKLISNADFKRNMAMGINPNARDTNEILPTAQEPSMIL